MRFVEQVTTPRRFIHSLGVTQVIGELAEVYGLDVDLAKTIAILHDAGKDLSPALQEQLIAEGCIPIQHECENNYVLYFHGPVGAYFVQKELGIQDRFILEAIKTHTFYGNGAYFHHPLIWCLRFSDLLEPNRDWSNWPDFQAGVENLRKLVYAGRLNEGVYLQARLLVDWFGEQGMPVHPNIRRTQQEFSEKVNKIQRSMTRQP
jgi:predicted HD superfamily hydrolase involved in NAD metabolism